MTLCRKRSNLIILSRVGLRDDSSTSDLKAAVSDVFKRWFSTNSSLHVVDWDVDFPRLDRNDVDLLEVPFQEEEIRRELMSADGTKAPDPDGFTSPKCSSRT